MATACGWGWVASNRVQGNESTFASLAGAAHCSYRWVKTMWHQRADVDCSKANRELGLDFIPLKQVMKNELVGDGGMVKPAAMVPLHSFLPGH
jgi:hypothetical protein